MKDVIKSDGGSTSYYELPKHARELMDLIEYKNMEYSVANVFKACYRLGEKDGNDRLYDLKKMEFFIQRLIQNELGKQPVVKPKTGQEWMNVYHQLRAEGKFDHLDDPRWEDNYHE